MGRTPYGAPQLDVPVRLNINENPYPPSERLVADVAEAVAEAMRGINRYPDRDATDLRAALAGYLADREGHATDVTQVWAANGSNEVMLQLFQAFGGPGRTALGFAPTYSMYPDYCRDTFTRWLTDPREPDFSLDTDRAVAAVRDSQPALVVLTSPNNPTGTAMPAGHLEAVCAVAPGLVVVDEAYAEFRRPGHPQRPRAARRPAAARRHPDHEQGVRHGRGADRLPRRVAPGGRRRGPAGPASLPPLGGRRRRSRARRWRTPATCRPSSRRSAPSATTSWRGCANAGCEAPTATRTSCCSAVRRTGARSGKVCWSTASSSARPGRTGWLRVTRGNAGGDGGLPDRPGRRPLPRRR